MSDKNTPVCAPMTTFTPDPTALAAKRGPDMLARKATSPIHVTNCKCVFAGHASVPDPRCVALHDAQQLKKARPAIVQAVREDLARQWPIVDAEGKAILPLKEQHVEGRITTTGTEVELAARWRALMHAESVFQNARAEIDNVLDEVEKDDPSASTVELLERMRGVLADQHTRPSPDFRALMVKAHAKLVILAEAKLPEDPQGILRTSLKEALRLTDVERLHPWPGSAQGRAMVFVVNALIEELVDLETRSDDEVITNDQLWLEQTKLDLEEARDKPEEYLARMAVMRRSRS